MASTSDNVQPLALMACERFESTLAMSSETTNKVQHVLLPSEPAHISFLKAIVGFFQNDCATQLGKSEAGLRFLALAAALVTSLGAFEGAKALQLLLKSTTNDATFLPTVRHLREVLDNLEARSPRCGFTELFVTWQMLLRQEAFPHLFPDAGTVPKNSPFLVSTPSLEAMAGLVDVFRQVARMGPATVIGTTIRASSAAPWVLAFAQWCVEPPSVFLADRAVVERPGSRIRVVLSNDINQPFKATIHHQAKELTPFLLGPSSSSIVATGMVAVEVYRTWLLPELGFGDDMVRLLRESLRYAIPQVIRNMSCGSFASLAQDVSSGRWRGRTDKMGPAGRYRLSPLPDIRTIAATCTTLLALKEPIKFATLGDSTPVAELPLVARHLDLLEQSCDCKSCNPCFEEDLKEDSKEDDGSSFPGDHTFNNWNQCRKAEFFHSLSFIIMDILALSLFDSPSTLLLRLSVHRGNEVEMQSGIHHVIQTDDTLDFDELDLISWARNMVGHVLPERQEPIVSSSKGQVIYPMMFDTRHIEKQGYLKLCCLPGVLKHQGETYDVVLSGNIRKNFDWDPVASTQPVSWPLNLVASTQPVSRPLNLCGDLSSSWLISVLDNRELWAALLLHYKANDHVWVESNPWWLLHSPKNVLLADGCPHDPRAQLDREDRFASYSSPWDTEWKLALEASSHVCVVAVDGADGLRCFALASLRGEKVVLRRGSCLSCCLNICRRRHPCLDPLASHDVLVRKLPFIITAPSFILSPS